MPNVRDVMLWEEDFLIVLDARTQHSVLNVKKDGSLILSIMAVSRIVSKKTPIHQVHGDQRHQMEKTKNVLDVMPMEEEWKIVNYVLTLKHVHNVKLNS